MTADLINGLFELVGGLLMWMNVYRVFCDKCIKGVSWIPFLFFTLWGFWNLYYYPSLSQIVSFYGGVVMCVGNVSWIGLVFYYKFRKGNAQ